MNRLGSDTVWDQSYRDKYYLEYIIRSNNIFDLLNQRLKTIDETLDIALKKITILEERVSYLESTSREGKQSETAKWPSGMPMQVKRSNHMVSNRIEESRRNGGKGRKWNEDQTSEDTLAISGIILHSSSSSSSSSSTTSS